MPTRTSEAQRLIHAAYTGLLTAPELQDLQPVVEREALFWLRRALDDLEETDRQGRIPDDLWAHKEVPS